MKKAWELEREIRDTARPKDRRLFESHWQEAGERAPYGDDLIRLFWKSDVPGSLAPETAFRGMVQAKSNLGYDVSEAEKWILKGLDTYDIGDWDELRVITAKLLHYVNHAPKIENHPYHQFQHPKSWDEIQRAMIAQSDVIKLWKPEYEEKIYQGWIGQLAGGSFGTAIEGYTGEAIRSVYGEVRTYITQPETTNDDVVYELLVLDAFEKYGRHFTSNQLAEEWIKQVAFGWSAEWVAIRNLNIGIFPPESGQLMNPYIDWIGVQMRGMICGLLAPNRPMEAARLATVDGVISHSNNGVYGGIAAAVMTSLAFECKEPREIIHETFKYIPQQSEYAAKYQIILQVLNESGNAGSAIARLNEHFKQYNWIHAYPNLAADLCALWFGQGDFTESMAILALAGNDVDCNAGLVGCVLGVIRTVPLEWSTPIGDLLETYLPGKNKISIRNLAQKTAQLAQQV